MGRRRKSKQEIAEEAIERHERLYLKCLSHKGRSGIRKLRLRLQEAHRKRMKAERAAGFYKQPTEGN